MAGSAPFIPTFIGPPATKHPVVAEITFVSEHPLTLRPTLSGPPSAKHPQLPTPPPDTTPPLPVELLPYKSKWTLTLPSATRMTAAAGHAGFFVGLEEGQVHAYDQTGHPVWTSETSPDGPLVTGDDLVFVAHGEVVTALDQASGQERWTAATGPLAVPPSWLSGWLFTSTKAGAIAAWRTSDGTQVWRQELGSPASARVAVDGDRLFAGLADRRVVSLRILEGGATAWSTTIGGVAAEPTAVGGRLYFGASDYTFYSLGEESGEFEWPPHRAIRSSVVGRPVVDPWHIWITTLNNQVAALSRTNGEIEWRQSLSARPAEQLIIDGGQVIAPLESGDLVVLSQRTGALWKPPVPPPGGTPPAPPPPPTTPAPADAAAAAPPPGPMPVVVPQYATQASAPGTKLAAPLLLIGPPDRPTLLKITLGADNARTVTAYLREQKPCPLAFLPCSEFTTLRKQP